MTGCGTTHRVAHGLWVTVPRRALRLSTIAGAGLADGGYLRAWPTVAATTPPAAAIVGLTIGALHPEELYTYSLFLLAVLAMMSALGACLGCWALAGFVVGDVLFARRGDYSRLTLGVSPTGMRAAAALALSYVLLAALLVLIPVVANAVRHACTASLAFQRRLSRETNVWIAGAVLTITQGMLVFLWTQSTPFLIRPVWSFFAESPEVPAIEPLQQRGWILALAVMMAVLGRLALEARASAHLDPLEMPGLATGLRPPLPWQAVVGGRTAFATFLLSGLLETWWGVLLTLVVLAAVFALHVRVLPDHVRYVQALSRVPLLIRLTAAAAAAYLAGNTIVQRAVDNGGSSFISLVVATVVSLLVLALLVPERPRRNGQPAGAPR